jgi:competence protein ComEC
MNRIISRFVLLAFIVGIGIVVHVRVQADQPLLTVAFLDVGQGDATFIETPNDVQVLIDGGPDGGVLRELQREMGFFDRSIDIVVATHFDQDHIGGLIDVLERYEVSLVLITDNESDTTVTNTFFDALKDEHAEILYARAGQSISLLGGARLDVLFPEGSVRGSESNASSIVLQLAYGETRFLLTGDAPSSVERYLAAQHGNTLQSDVLKVGHHGSQTSSDRTFVEVVDPSYGVISAGKDNRYGHPHDEVLDTLASLSVDTKNTADSGSITFTSDGETLRLLD